MTASFYAQPANPKIVILNEQNKIPAFDGSLLQNTPLLTEDVFNVKNYKASGQGWVTTDGDITSGSNSLINVGSTASFAIGQGIAIYGAGTIGVNSKILATVITNISGSTITLRDNASHTVTNAVVEHSDHEAIQAAINAQMYPGNTADANPKGKVLIPGGLYITHKPIHIGYGEALKSCHIYGDGRRFAGSRTFSGTAILGRNAGEPMLTINGARNNTVNSMTLRGPNGEWIETEGLGLNVGTPTDEALADWIDPDVLADFPNCNSRYAPGCCVAIDPYAGTRPGTSYPDMAIPAWMANQTQWSRNSKSSDVCFRDVAIEGNIVGVCVHPSTHVGNGDFIRFDGCFFYCSMIHLAWGNDQARQFSVRDGVMSRMHTAFDTGTYGLQLGKPDIEVSNTPIENCMRWFSFPTLSYGGTPLFSHCRSELSYRIGDGSLGSTAFVSTLTFEACEFGLGWEIHGIPQSCIANNGPTIFQGCSFNPTIPDTPDKPEAIAFDVEDRFLKILGCTFAACYDSHLNSVRNAINACGGVLCTNLGIDIEGSWRAESRWDLTSGAQLGSRNTWGSGPSRFTNRQTCCDVYSRTRLTYGLGPEDPGVPRQLGARTLAKSGLGYSRSGRVLTVTAIDKSSAQYTYRIYGGAVGDLVYDTETKTFFVIQSWDHSGATGTWKLYALNNYTESNVLRTVPTNTGTFFILCTRHYMHAYPVFGTITNGSENITNFKQHNDAAGTNVATDAEDSVMVGDFLFAPPQVDPFIGNDIGTGVASCSGGTLALTFGTNAAYTQDRKRIGYFVRAPFANDT